MRYVLIVLALMLIGCAQVRSFKEDPPKTVQIPTPCGPDDCGKPAQWEAQ